ncbi:MAG: tRNA pseudouridine(38-40) synthase TruA [Bacteroidota bacterium]
MSLHRYMLSLAYNGAHFNGWQRQPNAPSVQQTIEDNISLVLRQPIQIVGCGRTDTGVHASAYYAHFDTDASLPEAFKRRLNKLLPSSILIQEIYEVSDQTHARFSATERTYRYDLTGEKDPFRPDTISIYPMLGQVDPDLVRATAALLLQYDAFLPFCKTHSDAKTMRCDLRQAEWVMHEHRWSFHVSSDRFLRGMIRLIVGACLRVGRGQITLSEVDRALEKQQALPGAWSAPPEGLFLSRVQYSDMADWHVLF